MERRNCFWLISFVLFSVVFAQQPDTADQSELPPSTSETILSSAPTDAPSSPPPEIKEPTHAEIVVKAVDVKPAVDTTPTPTKRVVLYPIEPSFFEKFCRTVRDLFKKFISTPKVSSVLRNMATCIVNGVMEIVSYYFPAPLIPLLASAAGMFIPFEPVLMLRDRMPVTSYRRAFSTALNTFLGTFDKYKIEDNYEYDPYMTQRFHRRMMRYGSGEKEEKEKEVQPALKE